jgi:hypothetical protein
MLTALPDRFHFEAIGLSGFRVPQKSRTVQAQVWLFILPGLLSIGRMLNSWKQAAPFAATGLCVSGVICGRHTTAKVLSGQKVNSPSATSAFCDTI